MKQQLLLPIQQERKNNKRLINGTYQSKKYIAMNETFLFTDKLKKNLLIMMGIGLFGMVCVFFAYPENSHARFWSNILANTYYFTGIGLFGLFAVAAGQIAYGHWQTLEKRIFISLSAFTRIGGFLLVAIIILGLLKVHNLYAPVTKILDAKPVLPIYTTKVIYFAPAFWIGRVIAYATLWFFFSRWMDNFFARTDQTNPKVYKRSKLLCAAFVVTFALTESAISWDVIMSLDPGWYSTLFGWYNFASYGCAAWAMTILLVLYLKSKGYIERINENHIHDLGKLLFGFSIFWTYLWFDQFMLQWFANIPDETGFWVKRFDVSYFTVTIFLSLIINFVFPLLFLMTKGAKRNFKMIGFSAALLIFGHYIDFFNFTFVEANWNKAALEAKEKNKEEAIKNSENVVLYAQATEKNGGVSDAAPATENKESVTAEVASVAHAPKGEGEMEPETKPVTNFASIGLGEALIFIGFLGAFLYLFFRNLAKRPIIPEDDPYLKENERLVVTYA